MKPMTLMAVYAKAAGWLDQHLMKKEERTFLKVVIFAMDRIVIDNLTNRLTAGI
jgi:hypothetical protein